GIRDFHVTGVQTCALPILLQIQLCPQNRLAFGRDQPETELFYQTNELLILRQHVAEHGSDFFVTSDLDQAAQQFFAQPLMLESRSEEHTSELQSRENLVCR